MRSMKQRKSRNIKNDKGRTQERTVGILRCGTHTTEVSIRFLSTPAVVAAVGSPTFVKNLPKLVSPSTKSKGDADLEKLAKIPFVFGAVHKKSRP